MSYPLKYLLMSLSIVSFNFVCYSMQKNNPTLNVYLYNAILKDGGYECQKCKEIFSLKEDFSRHMGKKHLENVFECNLCGWKSYLESSVFLHKKRMHNVIDGRRKNRKCPFCNDICTTEILFLKHIKNSHQDQIDQAISIEGCNRQSINDELMQEDSYRLRDIIINSVERLFPRNTQMNNVCNMVEMGNSIENSAALPYN